jgi:dolichol kinase
MTDEAVVIIAAVGVGDAIAPMIGMSFGRHMYQLNPLASTKTMEGTIVGVFLGTVTATYLFLYLMGIPSLPLRIILAYAGIAAAVEATSPGNMDNLLIPLVIHFSIERVQLWLPE